MGAVHVAMGSEYVATMLRGIHVPLDIELIIYHAVFTLHVIQVRFKHLLTVGNVKLVTYSDFFCVNGHPNYFLVCELL